MCTKLTKLVSESEAMREALAKYQRAYGDVDGAQSPEGKQNSVHSRETEVKVHLKLVEEEAMLLSRRIVELEVENRGLRAEMSDLREKVGVGGGGEEDVLDKNLSTAVKGEQGSLKMGPKMYQQHQIEESDEGKGDAERSLLCNQPPTDGIITACHITREGPVGGEWDPSDSHEGDDNKILDKGLKRMTVKDYETLRALRDHSCILTSAIQLLTTAPRNGHSSPPSCALISPTDLNSNGRAQGSLNEALELLQAMLMAFIGRLEMLLRGEDECQSSVHDERYAWDSYISSFLCTNHEIIKESQIKQECIEDLCATEVKQEAKQSRQGDVMDGSRDSKMHLSLQILRILHHWSKVKGPDLEGKEVQ